MFFLEPGSDAEGAESDIGGSPGPAQRHHKWCVGIWCEMWFFEIHSANSEAMFLSNTARCVNRVNNCMTPWMLSPNAVVRSCWVAELQIPLGIRGFPFGAQAPRKKRCS